jgi:hypothetical protein
MNKIVSRFAYRLLLRLHPAGFQQQFGAEMLWIFDEQPGASAYLLLDGALSLLRQRCRIQNDPGQLSITAGAIITDPGIGPLRLLQGAISSSAILFCFIVLLGQPIPFTRTVRWPDQMACCTLTLQSISQVDVVCKTTTP